MIPYGFYNLYLPHFQNTQDASIVVIEQQLLAVNRDIEQVEDAVYAADQRIDSLDIITTQRDEQVNALEQTTSLLEEKVNVLENTDTEILETLNELENTDEQLDQRINKVEMLVGNITVDTELNERVEALERADEVIERRVDELEKFVNATDVDDLNERVADLEVADDVLDARVDRIEEETGAGEGSANDSIAACYGGYETLSEEYRRVGETGGNCDRDIVDDGIWYRFDLETGENGLLDICPHGDSCGTDVAMYVITDHPKVIGEIMQSYIGGSYSGDCDYGGLFPQEIEITKCYVGGDRFYLYKLWSPTVCYYSYCVRRHDDI